MSLTPYTQISISMLNLFWKFLKKTNLVPDLWTALFLYYFFNADETYQELLSPTQMALVSSLSGCREHRRIVVCEDMCFHKKYRTLDGTCNNFRNPMQSASLSPLIRLQPPRYENNFNLPVGELYAWSFAWLLDCSWDNDQHWTMKRRWNLLDSQSLTDI